MFVVCVQSSVRLQGGANQLTGRVEICLNNQWGTICDAQWNAGDVRVLCRQLGFSPNGNNSYRHSYNLFFFCFFLYFHYTIIIMNLQSTLVIHVFPVCFCRWCGSNNWIY